MSTWYVNSWYQYLIQQGWKYWFFIPRYPQNTAHTREVESSNLSLAIFLCPHGLFVERCFFSKPNRVSRRFSRIPLGAHGSLSSKLTHWGNFWLGTVPEVELDNSSELISHNHSWRRFKNESLPCYFLCPLFFVPFLSYTTLATFVCPLFRVQLNKTQIVDCIVFPCKD